MPASAPSAVSPYVISLSPREFEVCWEQAALGELPPVLDQPSPGRTPEERREIVAGTLDGLRARGLADRGGLRQELVRDLTTLARFTWAVDARIVRTGPLRARGAVATGWSVIAMQDIGGVTIRPVPAHLLIAEMVALAGEAPTTRTDSVSIRAAALDLAASTPGDDLHTFADRLTALGERPADARAVARLCEGAVARGQFRLRLPGDPGTHRVVAYHDGAAGRYLQLRRDGWVTFTPATPAQLAAQIHTLLTEPHQ
jgi:EspG family